mmetsp:Transcript_91095/g.257925  ORF Transcript_91095/g.257925 Transcript_91095/m.257925 type:complete len:196 (+) Transcript_91095:129-716(+)
MFAFARCCWAQGDASDEQVYAGSSLDHLPVSDAPDPPDGGERKTLRVPQDFCIRSVDSVAPPGSGYISLNEEQKAREMTKLQHMIRDFVTEFLAGVFLDAVLEDGSLVPCRCRMDSKISVLVLQVRQTRREIDLNKIEEIYSGRELRDLRVTTPLDDYCVTLVMTDDQCVSFKFENVQGREHFATCMRVVRLALD